MIDPITGAPTGRKPLITITINSVTYTLKYGALAQYVVSNLRLPVEQFFAGLKDNNAGLFSDFVKFFAAMVAHNFTALQQPIPPPEYWVGLVDDDPEKVREICEKVGEVLRSKIEASLKTQPQPAAPIEGATPLN